jgi:hypothetical protein
MNKHGLTISGVGSAINNTLSTTGNIRPNQTTGYGFFTSDMANILRVQGVDNGDSIVSLFLKLQLYSLTLAWDHPSNMLPLGSEPGKFDAYTKLTPAPAVTIGYNTVVGNKGCGGLTAPFLPFCTDVPEIAFHASLATVPSGESFYLLRPSLMQQNDRGDNAINIAMFILAIGTYPCGLHQVTVSTTDETGLNPADQAFIPFSNLVHIQGPSIINIVLPVVGSEAPPTTIADANRRVVVRPAFGPTTTGVGPTLKPAGTFIDVNARGAAYAAVDYAQYCASWMGGNSPIDQTSLSRFMKQMGELVKRGTDLPFAQEMACTLGVRYPAMQETTPNIAVRPTPDSVWAGEHANFFGLLPHIISGMLPEESDQYDMSIPELNPMFWNKVMSGCYIPLTDGADYPISNYVLDAAPRML